jgi:hypothetical protein
VVVEFVEPAPLVLEDPELEKVSPRSLSSRDSWYFLPGGFCVLLLRADYHAYHHRHYYGHERRRYEA